QISLRPAQDPTPTGSRALPDGTKRNNACPPPTTTPRTAAAGARPTDDGYPPVTYATTPRGGPGEAVRDASDPQRRPRGAQRGGQDEPRRGAPPPGWRDRSPRAGRGRHHDLRPRPRGAQAGDLAVAGRRALRVARHEDQPHRHARLRRLHGRRGRRP